MNGEELVEATVKQPEPKPTFKIYGMPYYYFIVFSAVVLTVLYLGKLPQGMIGAFALMIVMGAVFGLIGDYTPIIKSFLGGGAVVIIFGSAAVNTFDLFPKYAIETMTTFMKGGGFLDFYIAALITGSIMGMNRELLKRAAVRYLPVLLGGVFVSLSLCALVGYLTGYGAKQALLFISVPIMGGGMGAGAVPLSKIFGEGLGVDPASMLSIMVPAVALGNAMAIVMGGLLDRLGKTVRSISGQGELMVAGSDEARAELGLEAESKAERERFDLVQMGSGLFLALSFFCLGAILNLLVPAIHSYAWMILSVAFVKILGILPKRFEVCAWQWFQFVMTNLTGVLLVGIGIAYTNLAEVYAAFSGSYLLLVFVTVMGAIIGAGGVGKLVGFYPVESAITGGLCMANMGGTGDVAVLSASKRMELMPFAQISSRIGGAFMLILSSILLQILG
ncbi:MAG: 2-hydroxycarboxylate transporter family protein [Deltaproteobacteria bacterium]|jgi:Na+/citrate or Na+/malate symporter|nr:2-hydroxycarboxylate transporter family protein [Deltaproteobacteria bacterium]